MSNISLGTAETALGGFAIGLGLAGAGVTAMPLTLAAFAVAGALAFLPRPSVAPLRLITGVSAALACALLGGGLLVGSARVAALEASALRPPVGEEVTVSGFLETPAKRQGAGALAILGTSEGRIALVTEATRGFPAIGGGLRATGIVVRPEAWRRTWLRRSGVAALLRVRSLRVTGARRGGLAGRIDSIRERAMAALGEGIEVREAALARGFVLGSDEQIDPVTVQRFRRSGLSHLLAVSGQNVVLLSLLALPFLALAGLTLRARLVSLLLLIATYVLVTGAGPSIQRAGVMGAAVIVATLAARPVVRIQALLVAASVTLLLDPLAVGDPGWQLSFAATAGIMAWAPRLTSSLRGQAKASAVRASLAEGVAVCLAATVSTLPLLLGTFGTLPVASLAANLLVLPAVAPSMWLGMVAAGLGQIDWAPTAPINDLNALCLSYIEQVAAWVGDLPWSTVEVSMSPLALGTATLTVLAGFEVAVRALVRRSGVGPSPMTRVGGTLLALPLVLLAAVSGILGLGHRRASGPGGDRMVVCALDVGQGDALLLDPPGPEAALVDAGPPGAGIVASLQERSVGRLTHLIITHDQLDHAGGAAEVLASLPVDWLVHSGASPRLSRLAEQGGVREAVVSEGSELRLGGLDLLVAWPPRALSDATPDPGSDPNALSLVLAGRWRHLSFLLTGDSEAEATPMPGGPFDLLKVAHHGSEDRGLGQMLARVVPRAAVISVGAENPYGHPSGATVDELVSRGIRVLRTDTDGSVGAIASDRRWRAGAC